jgi:hypothetical protein
MRAEHKGIGKCDRHRHCQRKENSNDKAKHANAATFRAGLDSALAALPAQGKTTIAAMSQARVTTYADDPRLVLAEVVTEPSGKAEVRATAFLLDRPPGPCGQA